MSDMDNLFIAPSHTTPEILFSPEENIFRVSGISRPEDVRALYYPVIEWIEQFADNLIDNQIRKYSAENPFRFQVDLKYFNSSSAKFLYDILIELKRLHSSSIPVIVEWYYEKDDPDLLEAGNDLSILAEMQFKYIPKEPGE
jgi:hypothetical protein